MQLRWPSQLLLLLLVLVWHDDLQCPQVQEHHARQSLMCPGQLLLLLLLLLVQNL
jgi:hypothetical protein